MQTKQLRTGMERNVLTGCGNRSFIKKFRHCAAHSGCYFSCYHIPKLFPLASSVKKNNEGQYYFVFFKAMTLLLSRLPATALPVTRRQPAKLPLKPR